MAEVYLARSIGVGGFAKTVALKRMLPDLAQEPGYREMFMHEASIVSRLNHANIVQIFDFAEERGELYLAMEFVHGVTLRQLVRDVFKPPARAGEPGAKLLIPPMLAAHIGRGIARALAHAWQVPDESGQPSRLIHRDVSPHNVLLSYDGDVKLADFGIAKPVDRRTSVGTIKGKLVYMAPEQIAGGTLDARTDVFALGIVLYETATNRQRSLFEGGSQREVMQAINKRQIPPPDRMDPDFPKSFSDVIMKALEREPAKRFQSATELADALGECIHKEAKSALDVDLSAFMHQIYGETPPIRGLRPISQPPAPAPPEQKPAPNPIELELARRADDPHAETLSREQVDALVKQPAPLPVAQADAAPIANPAQSADAQRDKTAKSTIRERWPKELRQQLSTPAVPVSPAPSTPAVAPMAAEALARSAPSRQGAPRTTIAVVVASMFVFGAIALTVASRSSEPAKSSEPTAPVSAEQRALDATPSATVATNAPGVEAASARTGEGGETTSPDASTNAAAQPAPAVVTKDDPSPSSSGAVSSQGPAPGTLVSQPTVALNGPAAAPPVSTAAPAPAQPSPTQPVPAQPSPAQTALAGTATGSKATVAATPGPAASPSEPAPPRKQVRRAPVGKGSLWVQVTPWAFVAIDNGKKEEVAPAKLFDGVPAGVRTIELSNDAGFSRKLKVVVKANERAKLIGTIQDAKQVP